MAIDPNEILRSLALEGSVVNPATYDIPDLTKKLDAVNAAYRAKVLAGYDIPGVVQNKAAAVAPDVNATNASLEGQYAGNVDPNSPNYVDPSTILSLVKQRKQGGQDLLSRITSAVSGLYDKGTQSARFAVEDATGQLSGAQGSFSDALKRAQALIDEQRSLEDYAKKKAIDARYSNPSGAPTGFDADLAAARAAIDSGADPNAVSARLYGTYPSQRTTIDSALKGAGYSTAPQSSGGLDFFGPARTPITAEQYAAATGKELASVLAPSSNPSDQARVSQLLQIQSGTDPASLQKKFPATKQSSWKNLWGLF